MRWYSFLWFEEHVICSSFLVNHQHAKDLLRIHHDFDVSLPLIYLPIPLILYAICTTVVFITHFAAYGALGPGVLICASLFPGFVCIYPCFLHVCQVSKTFRRTLVNVVCANTFKKGFCYILCCNFYHYATRGEDETARDIVEEVVVNVIIVPRCWCWVLLYES